MKLDEVAAAPGAPASEKPKDLVVTGSETVFSKKEQTDAEEQVVLRRFGTRTGAGMGQLNQGELGAVPTVIEYTSTAGDLANGARTACQACKHWNQKAWYKFVSDSTGPLSKLEDRETIKGTKNRLALAYGPENVQAAMESMGICTVMTEIIEGWVGKNPIHWPVVTQDIANCPSSVSAGTSSLGIPNRIELVTPAAPFGLFKPRDLDAVKIGNQRRDGVLFEADRKL